MKKILSVFLALVMIITTLSLGAASVFAQDESKYTGSGRLASNITLDPDGDYIPEEGDERPNTTEFWDENSQQFVVRQNDYADSGFGTPASDGRVWANKVLTTDEATGNVQIQLTALGQQYSSSVSRFTPGVSNAVDAVLILDVTRSMLYGMSASSTSYPTSKTATRAYNMIEAVNNMVREVMNANPLNRIAIVAFATDNNYANRSQVLVPLGSYTQFASGTKSILTMSAYSSRDGSGTIKENVNNKTMSIVGGTNGQEGIALGSYQLWKAVQNKTNNEIDSIGNTVRRCPFVLYLTDGACNVATTRWYDNNSGTNGNITQTGRFKEATVNNPTDLELSRISALTILTASIQKERITNAYRAYNKNDDTINTTWFNIGLAVTDDDVLTNYAKATLSPRWCYETQKNNTTNNNRVTTQINNYASTATAAGTSANTKFATFPEYQYTKNTFSDQDDKEFIYYADSAETLSSAFNDLGMSISSVSKESTLPVSQKETILGGNSAIHFEDVLGEGVEIVSNPKIVYEDTTYELKDNGNGEYVSSTYHGLKIEYDKATRRITWDIPGKYFPQWTFKNGIDSSDGYNEAEAIMLKVDVAPTKEAIANGQRKFYSNAYENGVPQATVTYFPKDDNPFYFKTSEHSGVAAVAQVLGVNSSNISDYFYGETLENVTKGEVLNNVYFSGEMYLTDSDSILKNDNQIGTIISTLDTSILSDEMFAALKNSIANCRDAFESDLNNPRSTYAFKLGIPNYDRIRELKNANPTNTYPYIYTDEISNDGTFTFKAFLGNNALIEPICAITKDAPTAVRSTSTGSYNANVEYTVTVHNYSNEEITNIKVKDSQTGLSFTNTSNVSYNSVNGTFTINRIPANSDCTFKYTKTATTQKVENTATIESINGDSLLFGASDTSETQIVARYSTTYTVTFKDEDGTTLKTDTVARNGAATAPEVPEKPGKEFIGWDKTFDNITANTTVTARYENIEYKQSYAFAGECPSDLELPNDATIYYGDTVTPENTMYPTGKLVEGIKDGVNGYWYFNGWQAVKGVDSNGKATGNVKYEGTWSFEAITPIKVSVNDELTDLGTVTVKRIYDTETDVEIIKNGTGDYSVTAPVGDKFYVYINDELVLDKDGNPYVVTAGTPAEINYYSVDFFNRDGSKYSNESYDHDGTHKDLVISGTVITNKTKNDYWYTSQDEHNSETKFNFATPITSKTELFYDKAFVFNYFTSFNFTEPWQINCYCTLKYDGKYIDCPTNKKITGYNVYMYRGDLDEAQPTLDVLKSSDKTTAYSKGNKDIIFNSTTNVGQNFNRIGVGYNDIYIFQMKNPVYVAFDFDYDGVRYTSAIKDRSLYNVNETYITEATNGYHSTYTNRQYNFLTAMKNMYTAISKVCTSESDVPEYPHYTSFDCETLENADLFEFHTSAAIRNIEPWGYKIESEIESNIQIMGYGLDDEGEDVDVDWSQFDDFGILVYMSDKDVAPSLETVLTSKETANYSNSDGNVFYEDNSIIAYYFDGIKTVDIEKNIYVVSYAVIDGEYTYSAPIQFNYLEIAEQADSDWHEVSQAIVDFENAYAEYEGLK